jgi:RNA polymerase sigma-70 factor (ECF subfamily)
MGHTHTSREAASAAASSFDEIVLPHLPSAYRLARGLVRNEHDAEDVVQEASLRAFRYFNTFTGGSGRAWFLRIVRNTCYDWYRHAAHTYTDPFDEESHADAQPASDPEALALYADEVTLLRRAIANLPDRSRQLLVNREMKGLSYRELADVAGVPIGTVMSGLSRARKALRCALARSADTVPQPVERRLSTTRRIARDVAADRPARNSTEVVSVYAEEAV